MQFIEVAIGPGNAPGTFSVKVIASPAGEAAETVALDLGGLLGRRENLQQAVLASSVTSRRLLHTTELPMREMGKQLFTALLGTGRVAGVYRASSALASTQGQGLRLVLSIDDPTLAGLPWEAMYDDGLGEYVCREEPLVRHVPVSRVPQPLTIRPPLRILGIVSSPRGLPYLDVEKEQAQFAQALARPVADGRVDLRWAPRATWSGLQDMLLEEAGSWHVVHFIGHGDFDSENDTGVLALEQEDHRINLVAARQFVNLLRQARPMPRLVVLNSCSGAATGQLDLFASTAAALVRGGVTAVAAMQFEITDPAAIAFTHGFYTAIANNRGVDDAISSGRTAIIGLSRQTLEWVTPVMYLRGNQSRIFEFEVVGPPHPTPSTGPSPPVGGRPTPPKRVWQTWILAAAVLSLLLSMFLPFYTYIAATGLAEELRPIVDDWTRMRVIPSIVIAIAGFICELRVRLHWGALGLVACAAFLVIWESTIIAVSSVNLRVGFFFYLGGGLLLLLWATVTIWVAHHRASRTEYLIRWPYVLGGSVLLLVPLVWRLSLTATWSFRLYFISIAIAAAFTIVPKHITDARRDASLTAFAALAVAQLAWPLLGLLHFNDLFRLQYGGLVELGSAACVWIVLIRAQQTSTQEVIPATPSS